MRLSPLPLRWAILVTLLGLTGAATADVDTLRDAFRQGSVSGHLRAYDNHKDRHDQDGDNTFAAGLTLHGETAALSGVSAGATFYSSNGFGWQHDNPAKRNANLPEDVSVLGEAWLQVQYANTLARLGRQKVNTPFAGPADGFLIPFTFEAARLTGTPTDNLTLSAYYLESIKNRSVEEFVDANQFALERYGITGNTRRGTWATGAQYRAGNATWQGWFYDFTDLFTLCYAQVDYRFAGLALTPALGFQAVYAADSGDALLGDVNARGLGVQAAIGGEPLGLTLAWNRRSKDSGSFKGGALPAPFNTTNAPTYTNSMTQTLDNSAAGSAWKLALRGALGPQWSARVSYAHYQRYQAADTGETDLDITHRFAGAWKGLSLRLRFALIDSRDNADARYTETRTQLQYTF